eukprot:g15060.t1
MGYVEHSSFQSYSGPHLKLFLRYIDDIFGAASLSHPELEKFIEFASNFHPALTISDSFLPFLDISVSISGDRLATNIHHKPTDSHSYLDYTSSHAASHKDSIPLSQILHLRCNSDRVPLILTYHPTSIHIQKI